MQTWSRLIKEQRGSSKEFLCSFYFISLIRSDIRHIFKKGWSDDFLRNFRYNNLTFTNTRNTKM